MVSPLLVIQIWAIPQSIHVQKCLLSACNMQKLCVGCLEHGNTKWQIDAHDPVFCGTWHEGTDDITKKTGSIVRVQKKNRYKNQRKISNLKAWKVSVDMKVNNASGKHNRPPDGDANVGPAHRIQRRFHHIEVRCWREKTVTAAPWLVVS